MTARKISATLADVARHAEVSTATVSRCLNNPQKVIASTREKVLAAVQALNYEPHFGARVMAARRTQTIGAIIPTMENAIFARGLQAFQETLKEGGYQLLVASSSYDPQIEAEQIRSLIARGADGLLLIGHDRTQDIHTYLHQRALPCLVAWTYDPKAALPSVGFDNQLAMKELTQLTLGMGHRRIAIISATTRHNDRARARVEGVKHALREADLEPDDLPIIETHYTFEDGARAFAALMARQPRPSLVMCGNDVLAVGALMQAKAMGLRVPDDISVTGFDDIDIATVIEPSLTTVHVPHRKMGKRAAERLIKMIETQSACNEAIALPTEIRLRNSLAPPAS